MSLCDLRYQEEPCAVWKVEGACLLVTTGVDVSVALPLRQERMANPTIGATKVDESCFPYQ